MTAPPDSSKFPIREVWFFTSELESERASSFRQERWCNIFLDSGARLRIFNLRGALDHSDAQCTSHDELAAFRKAGVANYTGPRASVREGMLVRLLRRIKHLFLVDLYLPNVIKLLIHSHRLLKQRDEPIVLMASSPPFSVAVIGAILKRVHKNKVTYAIDMRDAWALHNALGGIKSIKREIERFALRSADHISTVSYGLAEEFERTYGVKVAVMYNVATHYLDAPTPAPVKWSEISEDIDPRRKQLVYTGSTPEGHYDLEAIVGSMVRLRQEHPALADCLQMVFVGACDEVRREAKRQGVLHGDIVFIGHLPQALTRSVQISASALLFLAHYGENNHGVVSTKLFEYLCLGKPILPLSLHTNSDVDRILSLYCEKSLNVHSEREMAQALSIIATEGTSNLPILDDVERVRDLLDDYRRHCALLLRSPLNLTST